MDKMVFTQAIRDIERLIIEEPFQMVFKENPEDYQYYKDELYLLKFININEEMEYKLGKKTAFRLMYNNSVFNPKLAEKFNIKKEDFNEKYTHLTHVSNTIARYEQSWVESIIERGEEAKIEEEQATINFRKRLEGEGGSFLRTLLHRNKYLHSKNSGTVTFYEAELARLSDKIIKEGNSLSELRHRYEREDIGSKEFEEQSRLLVVSIKKCIVAKSKIINKINYDKDSSTRMLLIKAMPKRREGQMGDLRLKVTSVNSGHDLIQDYCRWYNASYADEIRISREERKKVADQLAYNKSKDPAIEQRKRVKEAQKIELCRLVDEEKYSISKAAKELRVSKTTATNWYNKSKL